MRGYKTHGCFTAPIVSFVKLIGYMFAFIFILAGSLFIGIFAFLWELIKIPFNLNTEMNGEKYEHYCADYLRIRGYWGVKVTQLSGDYGVDITAHKGTHKYAIQCKYYTGTVGLDAVQQAVAGKTMYKCDRAAVMTNSAFTAAAVNLAESNGVVLLSGVKPHRIQRKNHRKDNTQIPTPATVPAEPKVIPETPQTTKLQNNVTVSSALTNEQLTMGAEKLIRQKGISDKFESEQLAKVLVIATKQGSISTPLIQRKLQMGYSRAARILDRFEAMGFVGPYENSKPRITLITINQLEDAYRTQKSPSD